MIPDKDPNTPVTDAKWQYALDNVAELNGGDIEDFSAVHVEFDDGTIADIYVVEKIGTKQGWACTSPDEDWFTGYPQETEAFYRTIAYGEPVESDSLLAADAISTIYIAYLSAERQGAAVTVKTFHASDERQGHSLPLPGGINVFSFFPRLWLLVVWFSLLVESQTGTASLLLRLVRGHFDDLRLPLLCFLEVATLGIGHGERVDGRRR